MTHQRPYRLAVPLFVALLVADFVTKQLMLGWLQNAPIPVLDGLLEWRLAFNRGVSFSMFAGTDGMTQQYILAGLAALVAAILLVVVRKSHHVCYTTGLAFIAAGALGNAHDRLVYGAVIDFIHVYYDKWSFPIFNVADSAITIGVGFVLLDMLLGNEGKKKEKHVS
ncbi:MAG: signal peptidase II [Proteobacteria bacterium]|nr:signal peptidase II [Pseudomonadota bacterium]